MEVVVLPGPDEVATLAADTIEGLVRSRPDAVLGVATGSTPVLTYAELVRRHRTGGPSYDAVTVFLLDEYVGLPARDPRTYRATIEHELSGPLGVPAGHVHVPDPTDPQHAAAYDDRIAASGGIDLQVLGIGSDGHLAFNEPGSSLRSRTRIKTLTRRTREDNARFFGGDADAVPLHVLTQGLGTISAAGHLLLLATGGHKADAVAAAVEGPLTASCPASIIQHHPHATVLLDEEAASRLARADHYREVYAHKPDWQGL